MENWKRPRDSTRTDLVQCVLTPGREHVLSQALYTAMLQNTLSADKARSLILELQDLLHVHWRSITWRGRCVVWSCMAFFYEKHVPFDGRSTQISGMHVPLHVPSQPSVVYPFLVQNHLIPMYDPVFTYSLRTLRNSMQCIQEAIQLHPYHDEMRTYWSELRAHLFHSFVTKQHTTDTDSASKIFDDHAWSMTTNGDQQHHHLSSIGIRSPQAIITGIDVRLSQYERWCIIPDHPLFHAVTEVEASEYAMRIFKVIQLSQWHSDQVVENIYGTMGSFYEHAGERWELGEEESVKYSLGHEAYTQYTTTLKSQAVIARMRSTKAVLVGQFSLPKLPMQVLRDHFSCVRGDEPSDETRVSEFASIDNHSYRLYSGYTDTDTDTDMDMSALTLRAKLMYVRYTHTFISCVCVKHRMEKSRLNAYLRDTVTGHTPTPSSYPAIVQTSDFRVHVAVAPNRLVVCPNVESAFLLFDRILAQNVQQELSNESGTQKRARLLREMNYTGN